METVNKHAEVLQYHIGSHEPYLAVQFEFAMN